VKVVDASVAVKWFANEPNSLIARQLLEDEQGNLVFPDIFVVEVAATLVRIANVNQASRADSHSSLLRFLDLIESGRIVRQETVPDQTIAAANLAIDLGHPLKDCIYLALAVALDCDLVTCDTRFAARAMGTSDRVRVLGA
jgi:predicted nucleic acid-binding protein